MSNTILTADQCQKLELVKVHLYQASLILNDIDNELYKLGSFPECPIGHTSWELKNTTDYINDWQTHGVDI